MGQPKYSGVGAYVQLDGASTDNIFTPDSASTSFSNDIEVVMRVKVTDWSTGAIQTLCGKYLTTGNQRSWRFYTGATGSPAVTASVDGSSVTTIAITPTVPLPDNVWIWLRLRLDLTNGSNSVGTLDTATDDGTNVEPTAWTANGSNTGATIAGVFDSTAALEIGTFSNGAFDRLTGQVGRCIVRNGFDGTTVADFNATDCYGDGYWHSDGYRWSLGLPKIYDRGPNGLAPATFGSGSNQPKWLPWTGQSNVYTPGASNNHVSTSTSAALRLTTSLEVEVIVADEIATPASNAQLIGNAGSGAAGGYALRMSTTRALLLVIYNGSFTTYTSTSTSPLSARQFKVTLASGVVRFYTAGADGVYSQLGSDVVAATAPAAGNGTVSTLIGAGGSGTTEVLEMRVRRAIIRDAPDGTMVADFNAELCGQSGYTDSLGNVWTVNRSTSGRKAVVQSPTARSARSVILHGTDDVASILASAMPPMLASSNFEVDVVARQWATSVTNGRWFDCRASSPFPGAVMSVNSGTSFGATLTDGTNSAAPTAVNLTYGQRTVAAMYASDAGQTFGVAINAEAPSTTSAAAVGVRTGADATIARTAPVASGYQDIEVEAVILRSAAGTQTERGLVTAYYRGGV